eukprot:GFUD01038979.1.p1 GENE.GFUD01038979.1~~GFUD01038979.1.p1  ORF type:complete len:383 (+),score=79.93 GFUD01038979.1:54-1202(+)
MSSSPLSFPTPSTCASFSSMFSWKISLEDWTELSEGQALRLGFESMIPPDGKKVMWTLKVCPKGMLGEERKNVVVILRFNKDDYDDKDEAMPQFQIETAYRIRKSCETRPMDMSKCRSLYSIHSSVFEKTHNIYLGESYPVNSVEHRAVDGFLTLEFEMKTHLAPKLQLLSTVCKQEFLSNFEQFYQEAGDVKIVCGGREFSCHKLLLTSQSPVFKAMFETDSKEKQENCVHIADCTPEAVDEFVFFLYFAMLRPTIYTSADLELLLGLVHLTSKYQVEMLMASCLDVLMDIMDVDNVLQIMVVVDKYDIGGCVLEMVSDFMKANIAVIVNKEDWGEFFVNYPSLVKDFILNMNRELIHTKDALKTEKEYHREVRDTITIDE